VVLKRRAVVQNPAVVEEVHVARFRANSARRSGDARDAVEYVRRLLLCDGQRQPDLLVARLDPVSADTATATPAIPGEHRNATVERRLVAAAAAIDVERMVEPPAGSSGCPPAGGCDGGTADHLAEPCRSAKIQTQKTDVIRTISSPKELSV
jgi:hypothetical protein